LRSAGLLSEISFASGQQPSQTIVAQVMIGPLTRTVADGALMMSVIASGPDDRDRRTIPNDIQWTDAVKGDIKGLRVAWTPDWGYAQVDPEVREVCAKATKVFADQLGCKLEEASPWKDDYFGQSIAPLSDDPIIKLPAVAA
jgi:Asp-tRNA(Asn)/Glu-tRNA(Gln) amidotransferase A subunit family amidase